MSIEAKDLKLMRGNYVLVTFDETETGFGKDYIGKVDAIQRAKIMVEGDLHWHPIDKIKPVAISPDILLKCGFVFNRNNELCIEINDIASHLELMSGAGGFYYPSITQTPQGDEERTVYFNRIDSLHQLQNLIHSLTGSELNVNF